SYLFKEEAGADDDFRHLKQKELQDQGEDALYQQLQTLDPLGAAKIHPHNHRRIIRALEIYEKTGLTISQYQAKSRQMAAPDYDLVMIGLKMSRDKLYERINQRVDIMLEEGLLAEVENLLQQGYDRDCNSMQGLGYRQMVAYYYGEATFAEAVYLLKRDTRHFAKRQLTWFRRDPRIIWFDKEDYPGGNKLAEAVIQRIEQVLGRIENEINRPARFLSE
ncbi:MAG: tRNA (adenosine(37)-N6)-dimethylallyltransferase MiaA, partial [Clostridiales bacterium]